MAGDKGPNRPSNVLFIVSHDIGKRFGCYGDPQAVTPTVDAFARGAYRFDNHFCQWPLCGPSRANLFTGCRPPTTRRFDNQPFFAPFRGRIESRPVTLPEAYRLAGYDTGAFGFVYHDEVDPPSWSEGHRKVEEWSDGESEFSDVPAELLRGWRTEEAKALVRRRWRAMEARGVTAADLADPAVARGARGPAVERFDGPDEAYPDGVVARDAAAWIRRRRNRGGVRAEGDTGQPSGADQVVHVDHRPEVHDDRRSQYGAREKPFFLAVGFVSGHTPFRAPARDWDLYDPQELRLPENQQPPAGSPEWVAGDSEPAQYYTTQGYSLPWRANKDEAKELLHGHYATVSYTDRQIGKLLTALEEAGLADSTVVVITSDHGFSDGHHGYWGKHNLWDESFKVPLLVRVPGRPGGVVAGLTEHVDLFPSLCQFGGLPVPDHLEGESFSAALAGDSSAVAGWRGKEAVYGHRRHMWHDRLQMYEEAVTVRTKRHRLTRYFDTESTVMFQELFDYDRDPEERENLAAATAGGAGELPPDTRATIDELAILMDQYRRTWE